MKRFILAAIAAATGSTAFAAPIEWAVADGGNGHFYELILQSIERQDADSLAAGLTYSGQTGYLVTITSAAEQAFLDTFINPNNLPVAISGSDAAVEGSFVWTSGPEIGLPVDATYSNWHPGEPNDLGGEDLMMGWFNNSNQWNDIPENTPLSGFVVEFNAPSPVPLPAGFGLMGLGLAALGIAGRRRHRANKA